MDERDFLSRENSISRNLQRATISTTNYTRNWCKIWYLSVSLAQIERATVSFADTFANLPLIFLSVIKLEYS